MPLQPSSKVIQKVVENESELIKELCGLICQISQRAIEKRGSFTVGLSGGSVAKFISEGLPSIQTDWSKWKFFFCDERLVPIDSPDSTLKLYLDGLVAKTPLTREHFIEVDTSLDVASAARDYEKKLRKVFPDCDWPTFDLLLLGMGPDGHTASLFPGHALLEESKLWIAPISDSPKPPPSRVTMTFPVINNSRICIFAMAGEGKAPLLKKIIVDKDDLPAGRVKPKEELFWLMDKGAASML